MREGQEDEIGEFVIRIFFLGLGYSVALSNVEKGRKLWTYLPSCVGLCRLWSFLLLRFVEIFDMLIIAVTWERPNKRTLLK